ncbi:MAG: carboxypeptidase-like regulatory domain-containing protein [Thermoplasmata archaeon]|nr:carboxypeptidase-like regulatory domain-containing protein [Thermoplasmata archaeon]MCI4340809.1 carboxypeptidase-like regulatory domain-containing protein [Thermoplasmata archaeon]
MSPRPARAVPGLLALLVVVGFLLPSAPSAPVPRASVGAPIAGTTAAAQVRLAPPASLPLLGWGEAFILYGPGDDTSHVFGEGAGMVAYDPGWNITLFGGEGSGGLTNATSNYNSTTGEFTWEFYNPSPSARANFSFATVPAGGFAVLFGGLTNLSSQRTSNETWLYWFGNQTWENVSRAHAPPARESAAFAVNDSGGVALLQGGWSPHTAVGNSSATVFWNDTWQLNLTTFVWTQLALPAAPPPMMGSGMIYDTKESRFDLFGGCAIRCSSALWSFSGQPGSWSVLPQAGQVPSPRASATYAWDGEDALDLVFGGFAWSGGVPEAYGDTFAFDPVAGRWTALDLSNNPGPRFDAPSTWAQYPGCTGLNVVGGSPSLLAPPTNASVLEPITAPNTNCFPDLYTGLGGPPPPPCAINGTALDLHLIDRLTGAGIANASVKLSGQCIVRTVVTNAAGYANVSVPSPDQLNLTSSPPGFHPGKSSVVIAPNITNRVSLALDPLPALRVRTYGLGPGGVPSSLYNVTVSENSTLVLGRSNSLGYLNVSNLTVPTGNIHLTGSLANHSSATANVSVPYTGYAYANLSLEDPGPMTIDVIDTATGRGIAGATGVMVGLDPANPFTTRYTTGTDGSYVDAVLAGGNYSITALAAGYLPGGTSAPEYHPWASPTVLVLTLSARYGANLSVQLENSLTGAPIAGGSVSVGGNRTLTTDANGWANFTDVLPPALTLVFATAPGFLANRSYVALSYYTVLPKYLVLLTPSNACFGVGCAPAAAHGLGPSPFAFLPGGPLAGRLLLVLTPVAILALALVYLLLAPARRRPEPGPRPGARP